MQGKINKIDHAVIETWTAPVMFYPEYTCKSIYTTCIPQNSTVSSEVENIRPLP